jgi:HemY protein
VQLRRKIWGFAALATGLIAVGAWGWKVTRLHAIAARAIPARPNLTGWPTTFGAAIDAAEARANGYFHAITGLTHLAELYHANGFFNEASVCYRGLIDLDPADARWPHELARILSGFGRIEEALPLAQHAVALAPKNVTYHLRVGEMEFKLNQISAAATTFAASFTLDPGNVYALLGLARCDMLASNWTRARDRLRESVERRPDFSAGWELLAGVLDHLHETPSSDETQAFARGGRFRDMTDPSPADDPDSCFDAYQLSVSAAMATDKAEAQRRLERAIELAPLNSSYHRQIAKLFISVKEFAGARQHLEAAVSSVPTDAEAWATLIDLLTTHLPDGPAARKALADGLVHCPESAYLHFLNGQQLAAMQRFEEAIAEFKTAIRFQPNEARAYVELSSIYVMHSRMEEALAAIKGARSAEPGNPAVLNLLVRLEIMSDHEAAAREALRALRRLPLADLADISALEQMFRDELGHEPR